MRANLLLCGATSLVMSLLTACAGAPPPSIDAVTLTLEVRVPTSTPAGQTLYLAGNINGWDPAPRGWELGPANQGVARAQFSVPRGFALQFKVTRGSWETVEKDALGQEIANRLWTADASQSMAIEVATWRDQAATASHSTVTGTVHIVTDGPVTPSGDRRTLRIRLPEGYEASNRRYPVLYMHDGQNLFDAATSFAGEWKVDETLTDLEARGLLEPTIVVGIDNSADRMNEYAPYVDRASPFPVGKDYAAWLVDGLKPWIDAHYRTKADPAHTALAGSSMGGLISLYTMLERPGVFGQVASFSGSFWLGNNAFLRDFTRRTLDPGVRLYLDVGGLEVGSAADNKAFEQGTVDVFEAVQKLRGEHDLKLVVDPSGIHNEADWARRFGPALLWLREGVTP